MLLGFFFSVSLSLLNVLSVGFRLCLLAVSILVKLMTN